MSACVTVVIPAYNAASLITRCIQSVLNQTRRFETEVIVVDDGSTDETVRMVNDLNEGSIVVLMQENHGPATARNIGLSRARGKYVAFLDADDYWRPEFLARTVDFLESHLDAIAVSVGQIHKIPGKPDSIVPHFLENDSHPREPQVLDSFFAFWAEHNHVCTGSVLMRTDVAGQTGGQRTEFRICEDLEFWAYLATFGEWGFIPEVLFVSDGGLATREQGWLNKNRRRWASAPTVEEWQKRIVPRLSAEHVEGFTLARARIAKNLAYSMILSGRDSLARQALQYCKGYPLDDLGDLLTRASAGGPLAWKALCYTLRVREWWRAVWI
jgi:glycosyltransferase involved in cell wall biosynthesis